MWLSFEEENSTYPTPWSCLHCVPSDGGFNDPGYMLQFKAAFTSDLSQWKQSTNVQWLKVATALDPRFKGLKCLPRSEREEVWKLIKEESAQQPEPGDPASPLKWWSGHAGAYPSFAHLAQKYVATPATRAERFGKIIFSDFFLQIFWLRFKMRFFYFIFLFLPKAINVCFKYD